jgi:hypothetical protein
VNALGQLLDFLSELQEAKIHFTLKCVRDAIMVTVVSPNTYYEIEFFADAHIEVQTFGPQSPVQTYTVREITDRVVRDVTG